MSAIPKPRLYLGWAKEILLLSLFLVQSPLTLFFRRQSWPGRRRQTILLLGDLGTCPLIYWPLVRRLRGLGFPVTIHCCSSPFRSLRDHARDVAEILTEAGIKDGILLGHGAGALVALSLPDAGRQRISRLITLAAPFHGSRLFLSLRLAPALRDIAAGSDFLLLHRMNALLFPGFDPFCAWQDEWIVPFNLAHFGQGRDLIVDQVGHYNLAIGGENLDVLEQFLSERYPPETPASAAPQATKAATPARSAARKGAAPSKKKAAGAGRSAKKRSARR